MKASSVIKGFIVGWAVASVATLLTTPMSGKELRKKITKSLEDLQENGTELIANINELTERVLTTVAVSSEKVAPIIDSIRVSVEEWKKDTAPHREKIQAQLHEIETSMEQLEAAVDDLKK